MPYKHIILPDIDLLYLEYSGYVTVEDQAEIAADTLANPLHRFELRKLSHSRDLTGTDLNFGHILPLRAALAEAYASVPGPVPWAQLATCDLSYGMARMFQSVLSEIPALRMEVFRTPEAALDFLGLTQADVAGRLDLWNAPR